MRLKTLPKWISQEALLAAIVYPLTQCEAEPHAAAYIPTFQGLLVECGEVGAKKIDIEIRVAVAQVRCDRANVRINRLADRISAEIVLLTDGNRDHAIYTHFFGEKPLSSFKKLRIDKKLTAVQGWPGSLTKSGQPTLVALVPELSAAMDEADTSMTNKGLVEAEKREFRNIGEGKQFIDKVNATFKKVHGELGKLQHEVVGLPNDFADRIFRAEGSSGQDDEAEEPTIESVTEEITELEETVKAKQALLAELQAKKLDEEKAAAEREATKATVADLQKTIAANEKLVAKLQAKLQGA
jgi:hypothetical protein